MVTTNFEVQDTNEDEFWIGVTTKFDISNTLSNDYFLLAGTGLLLTDTNQSTNRYLQEPIPANSNVIVLVDMDEGSLAFFINGEYKGIAVQDERLT